MSMSSPSLLFLLFVGLCLEHLGVRVHPVAHPGGNHAMFLHHLHVHMTISGHSICLGVTLQLTFMIINRKY